jgi:choline-sulfatase
MNTIDRREFLKLSGAVGVALAAMPLAGLAAEAPPARPNILIFLTDDHGQWAQHAYGNTELKTPNLDKLAATGIRMTNTFTPCPVCSPARASFWTGRMPSQHGIHDWLDVTMHGYDHPGLVGQTLLSELLHASGYHTGLVGKWHCGTEHVTAPGFDHWFSYWVNQYPHLGRQNFSDDGKHVVENGYQSPLLSDRAVDFIKDHRQNPQHRDKPFFLFVGYVDTHGPHTDAPPDLVNQYTHATFDDIPKEKFADCHGTVRTGPAANPTRERHRLSEYYGAVSCIDREVGKVIASLKETGQFENTLIIYTGDHGLNCGQHGIWEKGNGTMPQNFLEESIRIACTLSWPAGGILQNAVCGDIVNHCDLWATLLDIANATPDAKTLASINSPGKSYLPQLRGKPAKNQQKTQVSEYGNARMIRTGQYKLIVRKPFDGVGFPNELYDLHADPRETVSRYQDPACAAVVKELSPQIDAFFEKYTIAGHSGWDLETQPKCNPGSPWIIAAAHA